MKMCIGTAAVAGAAMFSAVLPARAAIVLSQPVFESGQNYAAFFKVEGGCGNSAMTSLHVAMPPDVMVLKTPDKPGWELSAERVKLPAHTDRADIAERVAAVTWRGRLDANASDQFGLFLKLPERLGNLYFPAIQRCETGEIRWTDVPAGKISPIHPAPMLELVAASKPASSATPMAGSLMLEQAWSPATPPGAATAALYLTIMNHGRSADTLIGGSTPVAQSVQVHRMSMANGIMSMREVEGGLPIPAGATIEMGPSGSYHVMLVGLKQPLKQGNSYPVTLDFMKGGKVMIDVQVAAIGARAPDADANHAHGMNMPGMNHH